jgi:hypothetical protein
VDETVRILENPANVGIIACLEDLTRNWRGPHSCHPDEAYDPYYQLGTHPDLVEHLWDKLTVQLPLDCRWVLHARPVLVHPQTGVVFAFATGSMTYAFRLPVPHRAVLGEQPVQQMHRYPSGETLDLRQYDANWIFGGKIEKEDEVCLKAYQSAAESVS